MLKYWLWLSYCPVSARAKAALIRRYGDAETAYYAPAGEFASVEHVAAREAEILETRNLSRVNKIYEDCQQQNLSIITLQDAVYPRRLRNIYDPPVVIYVKGRLPAVDDNAPIAIVGTRKASPYGLKMAARLAGEISDCGGIIVSGLTAGIDAQAAKGCLLAGGTCIGVLGTSHEQAKGELFDDVAYKGALISEYPPGTVGRRNFYRERNRISAGLSVGTLVVEAPEGSGALLFAQEAAEQGKEIFALPGNVDAENSAGCVRLLKDGAKPVTEGWDVLCEFTGIFPDRLHPARRRLKPEGSTEESLRKKEGKNGLDSEKAKEYIDLKAQLEGLSEEQLKIITAIDSDTNHIDDIIEASGLPVGKLMMQLTMLEVKGFLRRLPGNRIALNIAKK